MAAECGLDLADLAPVCPGIVSAVQRLRIGREDICTDTVLVEEARYPSKEKLQYEIKNLVIKKGAFSELESSSTPMPKYCFPFENKLIAYYVTAVPGITLESVLEEVGRRYPARYTWDYGAYLKDFRCCITALLKTELRRTDLSRLQRLLSAWKKFRSLTFRRGRSERIKWAASLVSCVREKHAQDIFQNNICSQLIFYSGSSRPKFYSNYTGVDSPVLRENVPDEVLDDTGNERYGPQFKDVYALAVLACRLITGERICAKAFRLDSGPRLKVAVRDGGGCRIRSAARHPLRTVRRVRAWLREALDSVRAYFRSVADETKYVEFRKLVRASGSPLRCIPYVRPFLDIWFPTRAARVLRTLLDYDVNERVCGKYSRMSAVKGARGRTNAELGYLCWGLKAGKGGGRTKIEKTIEALAASVTVEIDEVGRAGAGRWRKAFSLLSLRHSRFALAVSVTAAAAALFIGAAVWTAVALIREREPAQQAPDDIAQVSTALSRGSPRAPSSSRRRAARAGKSARSVSREVKRGAVRSAPAKGPSSPAAETGASDRPQAPPREDTSGAAEPVSMLGPVENSRRVYRLTGIEGEVNLAEVLCADKTGAIVPLRDRADRFTKFFICRSGQEGFGRIRPVRLCQSSEGECEPGKFYEAVGYSGTGEPASVKNGDLFAYGYFDLYYYKRKLRSP
jgi:hypothetical protein